MRRLVLLGVGAFALSAEARFDGWYCNEVSTNVVTPHCEWLAPTAPKVRAFFLVSQPTCRQVAELAQRMPLEYEAVVTPRVNQLGGTGLYDSAMVGCSPDEKKVELRSKITKPYDVYAITAYDMKVVPPDVTYRIFDAVENGAGLVVTGQKLPPFAKLFTNRTSSSQEEDRYAFGKGRIVHFKFTDRAMPACGALIQTPGASLMSRFVQENRYAAFIRGFCWAAGRDVDLDKEAVGTVRYRNIHNCDCGGDFAALPAGEYAKDTLNGTAFRTERVTKSSTIGAVALVLDLDSLTVGEAVKGTVAWNAGTSQPKSVTLELVDFPYERIWVRQTLTPVSGATNVVFSCPTRNIPTRVAYIRATVGADLTASVIAERPVYLRETGLPDYLQLQWYYGPDDVNLTEQFVDEEGFTYCLGGQSTAAAHRNLRIMPYFASLGVGVTKAGNNSCGFRSQPKDDTKWGGDSNFYNPKVQAEIVAGIDRQLKDTVRLGTILYSLGDENHCSIDAATGPKDLPYFRQFLSKKYGDIAVLNRARGTAYTAFEEVPHPSPTEALKMGDLVAWNDHVDYVETMFADKHGLYADRIREVDPRARVGTEGIFGGNDIEGLMQRLDWLGPYFDGLENDVLRSLHPKAFRTVWSGYHEERGPGRLPSVSMYVNRGIVRGNAWFAAFGGSFSYFAYDYRPSFPVPFRAELQRLRFAMAPLLVSNPISDFGIGVWWDHLSRRAYKADARFANADDTAKVLLESAVRTGFSAEYVSARTRSRLATRKLLFLSGAAVMDDESAAEIRAFVAQGGTLVADRDPAWFDRFYRLRETSALNEIFGGLTLGETNEFVRAFGKGRAIYLGRTLAREGATVPKAVDAMLAKIFTDAGVSKTVAYEGPGEFRLRQGADFVLASVFAPAPDVAAHAAGRLTLDKPKHIYRYGCGYVGATALVDFKYDEGSIEAFALFDERQRPPAFVLPKSVSGGGVVRFDCRDIPEGRTILVRIFDSFGRQLKGRNLVFQSAKDKVELLPIAYTDPKGRWTLEVTDCVTSLSVRHDLHVLRSIE